MNNIKHVFFDLDHTLWDFEKNSALTFQEIFKKNQIEVVFEDFLKVYSPINFNYWKLYREEKVSKPELRYGRLKDTFDQLSYHISDEMIDILAKEYIDYLPLFNHLFEGTIELLEYLKPKYELHIITNGFEEVQTKKMEKSNIIKYFDQVITSEAVGVKKPNPKIFSFAVDVANANPKESIMIGDNLEADIQGALDFGLSAIHCNFERLTNVPRNINSIDHLLEIKQYL